MGYPDQALERVRRSLEIAEHPDLLYSQAGAKVRAAHVCQLRRDASETLHWAAAAASLAGEQGYLFSGSFARSLQGWALSMSGRPADGMLLMRESIARLNQIGANMDRPYLLALLAEICAANGEASEALGLVAEALGQVRETRTYFYEAELYRLRAILLLQAGGRAAENEAEANLRQALGISKRQKAKALELRTAVSLCRLLHARGMPDDGLKVLAPVYRWFKEGGATADLVEAGQLLARKAPTSQSFPMNG